MYVNLSFMVALPSWCRLYGWSLFPLYGGLLVSLSTSQAAPPTFEHIDSATAGSEYSAFSVFRNGCSRPHRPRRRAADAVDGSHQRSVSAFELEYFILGGVGVPSFLGREAPDDRPVCAEPASPCEQRRHYSAPRP